MKERIIRLAEVVRRAAEILSGDVETNLMGMCRESSHALSTILRCHGIRSTVVFGSYKHKAHCWLEVEGQIIDITATQFDRSEKVYVPVPEIRRSTRTGRFIRKAYVERYRGLRWTRYNESYFIRDVHEIAKLALHILKNGEGELNAERFDADPPLGVDSRMDHGRSAGGLVRDTSGHFILASSKEDEAEVRSGP